MRGHGHFSNQPLQLHQPGAVEHLVHLRLRAFGCAIEHFGQFSGAGIIHQQLEKEPVQLRFGQRVGSLLVDGILCRQHEKRLGQSPHFPGGGYLLLLHRFEQRGLGLGRRAIDFISQDQVREDRASLKLEFATALGVFHDEVGPEDVGRHQVGGELDAVERKLEDFAQRADEQRLAEAGHAFEQHMAASENGDQCPFDDRVVANDHLADFRSQRGESLAERLDLFFGGHAGVISSCQVIRFSSYQVLAFGGVRRSECK